MKKAVVMVRKVLQPFIFSDGLHIPPGNVVCVPQAAMMEDPALYEHSKEFKGFRFANVEASGANNSKTRFSHPTSQFTFWGGLGRAWYVCNKKSLKLLLTQLTC